MKNKIKMFARTIENEAIINIDGDIGGSIWFSEFRWMIEDLDPSIDSVVFNIFSYGGNVFEGDAINSYIAGMSQLTTAKIQVAASQATMFALTCDQSHMASNGRYLIHFPWGEAQGDAEEFEKSAKLLRDYQAQHVNFYYERTGGKRSKAQIEALMRENRWLTAEEALFWGFIDKIIDPFEVQEDSALLKIAASASIPLPADFFNNIKIEDREMTIKKTIKTAAQIKAEAQSDKDTKAATAKAADDAKAVEDAKVAADAKIVEDAKIAADAKAVADAQAEADAKVADEAEVESSINALADTINISAAARKDIVAGLTTQFKQSSTTIQALETELTSVKATNVALQAQVTDLGSKVTTFTAAALSSKTPVGGSPDDVPAISAWKEISKTFDGNYAKARMSNPAAYNSYMNAKSKTRV
jgi:ATP-dependent protease ClpP protease subunit